MYSMELIPTNHTRCAPSQNLQWKIGPTILIDAKIEFNSNENQSDFLKIRFGETKCLNKHTVVGISCVPLSIPFQI